MGHGFEQMRLTMIRIADILSMSSQSGVPMYVCICRAVTDRQIRAAAEAGVRTMRDLRKALGVCSDCGKCGPCAKDLLEAAKQEPHPLARPAA